MPGSKGLGRIESYRSKWQTVRYIPSRNRGVLHICKNLPGIALCWARHEACCPKRLGAQHPEWCILPLSVDERTKDRADRPEGRMCLGIADFTVRRNVDLLTTWNNHRLLPESVDVRHKAETTYHVTEREDRLVASRTRSDLIYLRRAI